MKTGLAQNKRVELGLVANGSETTQRLLDHALRNPPIYLSS
jgi:hypothetical protein